MKTSLVRIAIGTGLLLLIPAFGMQVSSDWNWDLTDFIVIGILLFIAGLGLDIFFREKSNNKHKALVGVAIVLGMLWLWVELAVGLFTNWGS